MRTYATKAKDIERQWHVIDASGKTLGRLTTQIARLLMGKHKPQYVPYLDCGDHVIVLNASKVRKLITTTRDIPVD
jgi:large subunit ribosomal protein L13